MKSSLAVRMLREALESLRDSLMILSKDFKRKKGGEGREKEEQSIYKGHVMQSLKYFQQPITQT